jgi:hypothetical protein
MTPGFTASFLRWYNDESGAKVATADVGPYEAVPYGGQGGTEKHAAGKPPHPQYGQWQWGLCCSRTSRTIVIDIDKPSAWKEGCTFVELGDWPETATSYREDGQRAHIVIEVPDDPALLALWPKQGPAVWGDVKSNGFSYEAGVHCSGMRYVSTQRPWIVADAELLRALTADRIFPQGKGATGVMAGPWEEEGYEITSHDECVAVVMSMVSAGLSEEDVYARLEVIMPNREGDWPGRDDYIAEKIRSAQRKIEERERKEQDFWGAFHAGGYPGLVSELTRRMLENIEHATPQGIRADTVEWIEHKVAEGVNLLSVPLASRLNPLQRPIEPRGSSDKNSAQDILEAGLSVFRLADDEGCWLRNTGTHWARWGTKSELQQKGRALVSAYGTFMKTDEQLTAELSVQGTAESDEQIKRDDSRKEALVKSRAKFMNSQGQGAIATALTTEASALDRYSVRVGDLDSEPDVLWAGGYAWSLRHPDLTFANEVRTVNPVHMKTAACAPCPGDAPAFAQVLESVWPDPEVRAWALREIAGVMLWGATSKLHPVLDGPPHSGKSTFAEILVTVLGSYAVQVSPDKILGGDASSSHEEEVAAMIGARMVWMDEPPPGGRQSISRFNDLASGTGKLSAARKYQNRVDAPKLFNFLICQNSRNALRMDAQGVGERMTFIPCTGSPDVTRAAWARWKAEGQAEYPAVLALLIRECALFHASGRGEVPVGAQIGRAEAQERADEFGTWLGDTYDMLSPETLTTDPRLTNSPTVGTLRTQFNDGYARANGLTRIGSAEVQDQLSRLGIKVATAGAGNSRKKNVVFVAAKPFAMSSY